MVVLYIYRLPGHLKFKTRSPFSLGFVWRIHKMTAISSFITSLATSFVVFVILVLLFLILSRRPGNAHIYYPLRALRGELPLSKRRGVFTWAIEAFKVSEKELVARAGLDATVYIHLFTAGKYSISETPVYLAITHLNLKQNQPPSMCCKKIWVSVVGSLTLSKTDSSALVPLSHAKIG